MTTPIPKIAPSKIKLKTAIKLTQKVVDPALIAIKDHKDKKNLYKTESYLA